MTKAIIDVEKVSDLCCGLGQFCKNLADELYRLDVDQKLSYYLPKKYYHILEGKKVESRKLHWKLNCTGPKAHLWHATHQDSRYFPRNRPHEILTLHDLNFLYEDIPESLKNKIFKRVQIRIHRASHLAFISNFTRSEVERHFDLGDATVQTIYNGVCIDQHAIPEKPAEVTFSNYLFTIGTVVPKKNFEVLIDFIKESGENLVIAGSTFHPYAKAMMARIQNEGLSEKIILIGAVSEEKKKWLYQNCKAFVFPSLLEGFGLPVAEAMHYGKPLFLSNKTSLPEIGGTNASYFETFDSKIMAEVYFSGMNSFTAEKSEELKSRAKIFSWENAAKAYFDLYRPYIY